MNSDVLGNLAQMSTFLKINPERKVLFHAACKKTKGIHKLLNNTSTLDIFIDKIRSIGKHKHKDTWKGKAGIIFEVFVEAFILFYGRHDMVSISKYRPVNEQDDIGVDGTGIALNGRRITIQCKLKFDSDRYLTINADKLTNFTHASVFHYNVDPRDSQNMLMVTTGKGINENSNEILDSKVRCIAYTDLTKMVDNNFLFWEFFRQIVFNTYNN